MQLNFTNNLVVSTQTYYQCSQLSCTFVQTDSNAPPCSLGSLLRLQSLQEWATVVYIYKKDSITVSTQFK